MAFVAVAREESGFHRARAQTDWPCRVSPLRVAATAIVARPA